MEIRPNPKTDYPPFLFNEKASAFVRFDSFEERLYFASRAPFFSYEGQRHLNWMFHGFHPLGMIFRNYAREPFPQTEEIPYTVIGNVAACLTLRAVALPRDREIQTSVYETIQVHLGQQRERAEAMAETQWNEREARRLEEET